jgi:methylthioribose-1-phosphate isomerase
VKLSRPALSGAAYFAVELEPESAELWMLDQRRLPGEVRYLPYRTAEAVARGITEMVVRGAPAIGIAAGYAMYLHACAERGGAPAFEASLRAAAQQLVAARPTAVNLSWAVQRMLRVGLAAAGSPSELRAERLREEAEAIHREDVAACRRMGALGARDLPERCTILTHCNAGALATGGYGTALGLVRAARELGKQVRVLADETRPYLQGARLTAWELHQDGIEVEVITDSMAAHFMARGEIDVCVVGSDRIARNGDVANKIGTYGVAVLAHAHGVPFVVAAPWSTVDLSCASGAQIPIEERSRDEVARLGEALLVPEGIGCRHPAFDVTPARLVTRLVTELGVVHPALGELPGQLGELPGNLAGTPSDAG